MALKTQKEKGKKPEDWRENGDGRKKAELLTTLPLILGNWRIADRKAPKGM